MSKPKSRKKRSPKRVLALPDLEHAKTAGLNSLTSVSGHRTYDHAIREFVAWYCSEPRLAFKHGLIGGAGPDRLEYGSFALLPGTRFGPYEILFALGVDGMDKVYKTRCTRLDRTVETKILPESLTADPQFRERFDRDVIRVARWGFEPPYPRFRSIIDEDADYGFD